MVNEILIDKIGATIGGMIVGFVLAKLHTKYKEKSKNEEDEKVQEM